MNFGRKAHDSESLLDENNSIVNVASLNQDAEQLFAEMDVMNMSYAEGMSVILNKAYEMGFIDVETSEINIEVMFQYEVDNAKEKEITEAFKQPVVQFQEEKQLAVEVVANEPSDDIIVVTEKFEDGSIIKKYYKQISSTKKYLFKMVDNNRRDNVYVEEYYDENEIRIQYNILNYETGDYSEVWLWPRESKEDKEIEKKRIYYEADGEVWEDNQDEKGNPTFSVIDETDGSHTEITFYENGNRKHAIIDDADGVHAEIDYYENGNRKTEINNYADGSRLEWTCYESGNAKTMIGDDVDGSHHEYQYDEKGNLISGFSEYADGRRLERFADGSYIEYQTNGYYMKYFPDGSIKWYDADGNEAD